MIGRYFGIDVKLDSCRFSSCIAVVIHVHVTVSQRRILCKAHYIGPSPPSRIALLEHWGDDDCGINVVLPR
jgi:hypothetical protein